MSENLFVMPSGETLPRCTYCLDRPVLYRLKDYRYDTGDVFDAYFCKDCDGIEPAVGHHGMWKESTFPLRPRDAVKSALMEERMFYHSWAAEQTEEVIKIDILYGEDAIAWFNDYEPAPFNNSRQGDI